MHVEIKYIEVIDGSAVVQLSTYDYVTPYLQMSPPPALKAMN